MVLPMLLVLKLFKLSPLLWPFNMYLPLARQLPRVCITISSASAVFACCLREIASTERQSRQRFERVVCLVFEQLSPGRSANRSSMQAIFALSL